jgi:Tol biopolymer transport system component
MSGQIGSPQIREELDRILAGDGFRNSPRLSRLLQYLVDASLSGSGSTLKEYSIGVDVFDKPQSFDPRADSTVRGEVSKLRTKLRLYYETGGRTNPVVIEIPKGGYVAAFRARSQPRKSRWHIYAAAGLMVLIGGFVWHRYRHAEPALSNLTRITNDIGLTAFPALSPGGDLLVFASDRSGRGDLDLWVQPLGGGEARRLTDDPADDYDAHFSPDGSSIAFRSERRGGGIYSVPVMGGNARFIVQEGHHPRLSPDGAWIAYSVGSSRMSAISPGSGHMFVVGARGGTPRPIQPDFLAGHHPIWSRDGKHLLFFGRPGRQHPARTDQDWWITPVEGGEAIRTGAITELIKLRLNKPVWPRVPLSPSDWSRDSLLFSGRLKDSIDLWKLPISARTFRIAGPPERLTVGVASEVSASFTPSGDVVFADVADNYEIWSLPIDANRGVATGPMERLTQNAAIDRWPSISRDGRRLMYLSFRTGHSEVWLKELDTGRERQLTSDGTPKDWPEISPDGTSYYFTRMAVPDVSWAKIGSQPSQLCTDCQTLWPLPEGTGFLHVNLVAPQHPHLMDSSGRSSSWLRHPKLSLHQPQLSPDGHWVAFQASLAAERGRIFIARFRKESPPGEEEWIAVTDGEFLETTPLWSPDGNRLYFGSNRDDSQCIWSAPLDPVSKRPLGEPEALAHFHRSAQRMGNVGMTRRGMSVARDRIVFPLVERTGNIWVLRPR